MASDSQTTGRTTPRLPPWVFSGLMGVFLGLALLKFANPPIMEKLVQPPAGFAEWLLSAWPIHVGYWLLALVVVVGFFVAQFRVNIPKWLLALPLVWLGWQLLSAAQSVDAELTRPTLKHFAACVVCFHLGVFSLGRDKSGRALWVGIVAALGIVFLVGIEQHFGGLEETRRYFYTYLYPQLETVSPDYLKKISSDRIFSTLFYPNALAGAILLLLPPALVMVWRYFGRLTVASRILLAGLYGGAALGCLYWSGSKGGWLLALTLVLVVLLHLRWSNRAKWLLVGTVCVLGIAGFLIRYAAFFERGATSVGARFDYWRAATQTTAARPLFGTGPGTFSIAYQAVKKPESEMARLTHNDYLQQASDSGWLGCATYSGFIVCLLMWGYARPVGQNEILRFAVWLGLLGWALQGLLEFGLYIPALSWSAFALAGWLLGTRPVGAVKAR